MEVDSRLWVGLIHPWGAGLARIGVTDLLVLAAVVLAVVGALRAGRGLLGAVGSAVGTLVLAWLVVSALTVWGPRGVADATRQSTFAGTFPAPTRALAQLGVGDAARPGAGPARPLGMGATR